MHPEIAKVITEADLLATVREMAERLGWLTYHTHDSRHSPGGFPDLVLAHLGQRRLVFAELKREGARATAAQADWLIVLGRMGPPVEAYLWKPSHLDAIEHLLRGQNARCATFHPDMPQKTGDGLEAPQR